MARQRLPRPTAIPPGGEPGDRERSRDEARLKFGEQRARDRGLDLVLHGDVWSPAGLVLRGKERRERVGQALADRGERGRVDTVSDAPPQAHDGAELRWRRRRARFLGEPRLQLGGDRRRQMVEQGEMRPEEIALGRKVPLAQAIEPGEIKLADQRGDDDGDPHD